MKSRILTAALGLVGLSCALHPGLVVTHTPNPSDVHAVPGISTNPFPYMWYYRTTVSNATARPIQITTFEGYFWLNGKWVPKNIMNRKLTSQDFDEWFALGGPLTNGWLQPRQAVACDPNWHGYAEPVAPRTKWTFAGVDDQGRAYRAEAEIGAVPIR
jgi:hypothetical protein